jgi:hypothetical protein
MPEDRALLRQFESLRFVQMDELETEGSGHLPQASGVQGTGVTT